MKGRDVASRGTGSWHRLANLVVDVAAALAGLCWGYVAQGCAHAVVALLEGGHGRISAVVFLMLMSLCGLIVSIVTPIWLQRWGKTWLELTGVVVSFALLGGGVFSVFRAAGM